MLSFQLNNDRNKAHTHNRRLAKKRVQCLNKALCPDNYRDFVLSDSLELRNPLLRQAPKRYGSF